MIDGQAVKITVTDKYPNTPTFRWVSQESPERIAVYATPVDATDVPEELDGFRTLFTSFHHFDVEAAREILRDAVRKNQGIGVFEYTERNPLIWTVPLLLGAVFVWLGTPFIRPFRWQRLLWNYVFPVWMLFGLWDGIVSCLRTYSPQELQELVTDVGGDDYSWEIGRVRSVGALRITYLIGIPKAERGS